MNRVKYSIMLIIYICLVSSCKINRYKDGRKVGRWVTNATVDGICYKSVESYRLGIEKGTWKSFINKRLVFKEKYKKDTCYRTNYYSNGQISSQGKTTIDRDVASLHWYYIGDWKNFDESGKLKSIERFTKRTK